MIPAEEIDTAHVPVPAPEVASVELDGETVLYHEITRMTHILSPVATVVWSCFDGSVSIGQLAAELADAYGAPRETVEGDVVTLARELGAQGLLDGVAAEEPAAADDDDKADPCAD
ncbi:MAG TPA: PqqD family protein [Acidimicrobiales bacterium]|nr:PqqD family protein [Acidimicrobiales bacterium]